MSRRHFSTLLTPLLVLALAAPPARAARLLLDIDTDGDPSTIVTESPDSAALVALVLWPDYPDERIEPLDFGLGGSCKECGLAPTYGLEQKLLPDDGGDWVQDPGFTGTAEQRLTAGCGAEMDYYLILHLAPVGASPQLDAPLVLARFWVQVPAQPVCDQPHFRPPAPDLATFDLADPTDPEVWNSIRLLAGQTPAARGSWTLIKGLYR